MKTKKPPKAKKPRPKRPKQTFIPGTEPPSIKAIDEAAEIYVLARDERMSMLADEVDAKDKLLALMKENDLLTYEYDRYVVQVDATQTLHVKRKKVETIDLGNGKGDHE